MILKSISIKNIGAHRDTKIEFDKLDPIVAITGQNGSGKTFLLESIPAIFYGAFPTRPGSLYDRITKGFKGQAEMEVVFEFGGKAYRAVRRLKNSTKTGKAEGELFCENKAIAGPKVEDFERAVQVLLGDQAAFLASVYSSQRNTGDLCDARPAERKAIFGEMLGLHKLDKLAMAAKEKFEDLCLSDDLEARERDSLQKEIDELKVSADLLPSLEKDLVRYAEKKELIDKDIERVQRAIVELSSKTEKIQSVKRQITALESEILLISRRITATEADMVRNEKLLETADKVQEDIKELREMREVEEKLRLAEQESNQFRSQVKQAELKIGGLERELRVLNDQAGLIERIPNVDACPACPLAKSAYEAADKIPPLRDEILTQAAALKALVTPSYNLQEHDNVRRRIRELSDAESKLAAIAGASEAMLRLRSTLGDLLTDKANKGAQVDTLRCELGTMPQNLTAQMETLNRDLVAGKHAQADEIRTMSELNQKIGKCKRELEILLQKEAKLDALCEKGMKAQGQIKIFEVLAKAFGRSGIQPLIIDSASPKFESIADDLLQMATDGRMQIRFETQKTLKSGDVSESLDIIVTRDGIEQDIAEFSGGEQKLIKTIIRLTLAIYQATHSGRKLRTIFIDEIFDDLDADNSQRLLIVLGRLRDYFEKIIVISHNDELLTTLPSRVNLRKGNNGTEVEVI